MGARKLPSGNWNVRVMVNGVSTSYTAPTRKEAERMAAIGSKKNSLPITLGEAVTRYIDSKSAILSESTIRGYRGIEKNNIDAKAKATRLDKLTNEVLQNCLNECAKNHSPKTVDNTRGLITSTLKMFMPEFHPILSVPAKIKNDKPFPTEEHLRLLMSESVGLKIHLPIVLAAFGSLRKSEVSCLYKDCVFEDHIKIKRVMIKDEHGNWVVKLRPKSWAGYRDVYLPPDVMEEVHRAADLVGDGEPITGLNPQTMVNSIWAFMEELGLPHYTFHSLRHFYASFSHQIGISDKQIMEAGGWSDANTLHKIYQHAMPEHKSEAVEKVFAYYNNLTNNFAENLQKEAK